MTLQKSPTRLQHGGVATPSLGQPPGCQRFLIRQVVWDGTPQLPYYTRRWFLS